MYNYNEELTPFEAMVSSLESMLDDLEMDSELTTLAISNESDARDTTTLSTAFADLNEIVDTALEEMGIEYPSAAQSAAGRAAAILSLDPESVMRQQVVANISVEDSHNVLAPSYRGLTDRNIASASPSNESYDSRNVHNMRAKSVGFNLVAPDPSDFVKTWFPFVILKPSDSGYKITIDLLWVAKDVMRNFDASPTDFGRKTLTYAAIDSSILGDDHTRAIPHVRPDTQHLFTDPLIIPNWTAQVENEAVDTNYLKFGQKFDLIKLSQTDLMLSQGDMDATFQLDLRNELESIVIDIDGNLIRFDVGNIVTSTFVASRQEAGTSMNLNFGSVSLLIDKNTTGLGGAALINSLAAIATDDLILQFEVDIHGSVDIDEGTTVVYADYIKVYKAFDAATRTELALTDAAVAPVVTVVNALVPANWLGYSILAYRSNLNHHQRGQLIGSTDYTEEYYVPLRTPYTIVSPTTSTNDSRKIANLVSAIHIDMNNEAASTLLKATDTLRDFTTNANVDLERPDFLGIGRIHLRPRFIERYLDLPAQINSITSHERAEDIRAVIVNSIRDVAARLYTDSNWQAAQAVLKGSGQYAGSIPNGKGTVNGGTRDNRPTVIIGVSTYEASYLYESGDSRLLTDLFNYKVVTNDNLDMRGKIILGLTDGNDNGSINPLGVGNTLYAPELLFNLQITRHNQTSKEVSVFKHYRMIVNTPVMGLIHVKNMDEALGQICEPCLGNDVVHQPPITAGRDQQGGGSSNQW